MNSILFNNKNIIKVFRYIILAFFSSFAFTVGMQESFIFDQLASLESIILIICFYLFYKYISVQNYSIFKINIIIPSMIFSFFMLFGAAYQANNTCIYLFTPIYNIFFSLIKYLGYFLVFSHGIALAFKRISSIKVSVSSECILDRHPILFSCAIMLLCWLPYYIITFPGILANDTYDQLNQVINTPTWTSSLITPIKEGFYLNNHHPAIHTGLLFLFFYPFIKCGSAELGIVLYTIVQIIVSALLFSYVLHTLKKIFHLPNIYHFFSLGFFCLFPLIPIYVCTISKDTTYSLSFLLMTCWLINVYISPNVFLKSNTKLCLGMLIVLLCIMLRNTGIYIIILSLPFLFIGFNKVIQSRKLLLRLLALFMVPIFLCLGIVNILYPLIGITPGSRGEMFSLPFQQTARYLRDHSNDVTESERKVLERVFYDVDSLPALYNPVFADPVKAQYNKDATSADIADYLKVWASHLTKHPGCYIDAAMNQCFKYFYPDASWRSLGQRFYFGNRELNVSSDHILSVLIIKIWDSFSRIRSLVETCVNGIAKIPFINLFFIVGVQSCIIILCLFFLFHHRRKGACILTPFAMLLFTCILSPVNGSVRYTLPLFLSMPLVVGFVWNQVLSKE